MKVQLSFRILMKCIKRIIRRKYLKDVIAIYMKSRKRIKKEERKISIYRLETSK